MSRVINRMADVLLALEEARTAKVRPTKIQLQKFVYLTDVLAQIVGALKPLVAHKTYRNGPYDLAIQNAVDALAFRGLVRVAGVWRTPSGHMGTSYVLADSGVVMLRKICGSSALSRKTAVARLVGAELRELGWGRIVDLVYAEPTYVNTRPTGWGERLEVENGLKVSAAFLIAAMRRVATTLSPDHPMAAAWVTNRFFAYLSDFDERFAHNRRSD